MKLLLILGAILGLASASPVRSLQDDLNDLLALIPIDDIKLVNAKYANDPEVQIMFNYLRGDEFKAIVSSLKARPEWDEAVDYLKGAGLDVEKIANWIGNILQYDSSKIAALDSSDALIKSFHGWAAEIRALIPTEKIVALIREKTQTSPYFQELLEKLSSPTFKGLAYALVATPEYQKLLDIGRAHGAPVDAFLDRIHDYLGW